MENFKRGKVDLGNMDRKYAKDLHNVDITLYATPNSKKKRKSIHKEHFKSLPTIIYATRLISKHYKYKSNAAH